MSLSGSISNALTGLLVNSRAAQMVSSNLSNALNEGYSPRSLELVSDANQGTGGVRIAGIRRAVDPVLLADRRGAQAAYELANQRSQAAAATENLLGTPDDPASISAHLLRFDAALRYAESTPNSDVRLQEVAGTAGWLAQSLNTAQSKIQQLRMHADRQIASAVSELNQSLTQVEQINRDVVSAVVQGQDPSGLLDQRQSLVDRISELVPVHEMQRSHGAVSLVTTSGYMLLDHSAKQVDFAASNVIMPHMTAANGLLGTLEILGDPVGVSGDRSDLSGGRLQGLFDQRDRVSVEMQEQLDGFALDLAERFNDLAADTSLTATDAGLFTDAGLRAEAINEVGLAGRLELNDQIAGGQVWRLRDGLNTASPGVEGDASILTNMIAQMGISLGTSGGDLFDRASDMVSHASTQNAAADQGLSFASARFQQLELLHREAGVDTDAELQRLLVIETNYAANAQMIQTVDEMLNTILGIT